MAATDVRPKITLACQECKHRNYITKKNRRNDPDRLELKKYCPWLPLPHGRTARPANRGPGRQVALNKEFVGRVFGPGEPYEVSRVKIAEFADAIGEPSELCRDKAAAQGPGYPDVIAPPTLAIIIAMASTASMHSTRASGSTTRWSCTASRASATPARCTRATWWSRRPRSSRSGRSAPCRCS